MYGGLTFVPAAIGAWVGGYVSGKSIYVHVPELGHAMTIYARGTDGSRTPART